VLNGSRRLVVLDEVLNGVSIQNKPALSEALWAFTEIGFQFIICEHAFIPEGAKVYEVVNNGGVSSIARTYIQGEEVAEMEESELV
jgi:ABC-type cobalamin transport system ATPase subunit